MHIPPGVGDEYRRQQELHERAHLEARFQYGLVTPDELQAYWRIQDQADGLDKDGPDGVA